MKKITAADPESRSADLLADNIEKLRELFPQAFTEGKVDFQVLRELLGDAVDDRDERYGLNWHGKAKARRLALTPSTGTLRPMKEESVDWDTTQNLIIEGDNLEVLKLLQKSYAGKVKLIYIDPPYNTGRDFVYPDDFRDNIANYLCITGQVDEGGQKISSNTESSGRFHTEWLNMLYPRLVLARGLLRSDGAIFVSIDDTEVAQLRALMDEIFGSECFVTTAIWEKADSPRNSARQFSEDHDYVVIYAKQPEWAPQRLPRTEEANSIYKNPDDDPRGPWLPGDPYANKPYSKGLYSVKGPTGREFSPPPGRYWRISEEKLWELNRDGRIWWGPTGEARPSIKRYLSEVGDLVPRTLWRKEDVGSNRTSRNELRKLFPDSKSFDTPKPTGLVFRMLQLNTRPQGGDIVVDFFAGSGTTGDAVMRANAGDGGDRRFILVQLPEPTDNEAFNTISEVTRERIRRAAKLHSEQTGDDNEIDLGFKAFRLASTNMKPWDPNPADLQTQLGEHVDHIKPDRTENDLLYEVLLKLGIDLSVPIETRTIAGFEVHNIGAGQLLACFGTPIRREDATPLARGITAWHDESRPEAAEAAASTATLLFRDSAFEDDVAKQNLVHALEQAGLTNVRSL